MVVVVGGGRVVVGGGRVVGGGLVVVVRRSVVAVVLEVAATARGTLDATGAGVVGGSDVLVSPGTVAGDDPNAGTVVVVSPTATLAGVPPDLAPLPANTE